MARPLVIIAALLAPAAPSAGGTLDAFSYADSRTAAKHWTPRFGSKPVRVEELADGNTCLALDAEFGKQNDRACWDWQAPLDLSEIGRISFDISATNGGLSGNTGIYFGTANGWYATFWWGGPPDTWTPRTFHLDEFSTEENPDGWDKITTFRFSVWSTGAGKTTYRLRNFRTYPSRRRDPAENFLKNGSFEIVSSTMPYAWSSGHWGVGDMPWAADMDRWREHWRLDRTVAKHGTNSLCIDNTPDLPLLKVYSAFAVTPKSVKACVLSAWLRSDQTEFPVTLSCGGKSVTVEAGREWTQGVLRGVPRSGGMRAVVEPGRPGELWIDAVQLQECEEPTSEFHPAFVDEGIAAREKLVDWSPPRRTPQVAAGRHIAGPAAVGRAEIDSGGRFLLDGKPYIQHSLGLEFVKDLGVLDFVAQSGFRDVCVQVRWDVKTERLRQIFDRCTRVGLRVIPWLDGRIPREQFENHITTLRDHPAPLCWYVYDEPSGKRFAEANARLRLAKELDPTRPALINYLASKLTGHLGDIYSTDVYPIPHGSPSAAISAVREMQAAAEKESKPVWMWLQGTGFAYWMDREPTPRELSCMVYGSLIAGARGIYYFAQVPRTKECFDEMRALLVEVDALAPALCSLDTAPAVSCGESSVMCGTYAHGGQLHILAVNTRQSPVHARLTGHAAGPVEVLFEGRQLQAEAGAWTDAFGPYERHVYRFAAQ